MLRPLCLSLFFLASIATHASELPAYLRTAFGRFDPEIPPDLAYTVTTRRDGEISVERFDPSVADARQWTLIELNQRPATEEEKSRYSSYRISTATSARPTFKRGDIDLNSFRLLREDAQHATYRATFRDDLSDALLLRLELEISVLKQSATIDRYVLLLAEPYSPVLTVKMLELRVDTILAPAQSEPPSLPRRITSRFRGRVLLFKSIAEDVETDYSAFTKVIPFARQPPANPP